MHLMEEVEEKTGQVWDPGPERSLPFPSSNYNGLAVNDSSDIHVGTKYVADNIVIVLPKSESLDVSEIEKFTTKSVVKPSSIVEKHKEERLSFRKVVAIVSVTVLFVITSFVGILVTKFIVFSGCTHCGSPMNNSITSEVTYIDSTSSTAFCVTATVDIVSTTATTTDNSATVPTTDTTFKTSPKETLCSNVQPVMYSTTQTSLQSTVVNSPECSTTSSLTSTPPTSDLVLCPDLDYKCKGDFPDERYLAIQNSSVVVVNVSRVADGVCFVQRSLWGGWFSDYFGTFSPVSNVIVHFIDRCDTFNSCSSLMRGYEHNFLSGNTDFIYNFVIGGDCRIYEGVGWDGKSALSNDLHIGVQLFNSFYIWHNTLCDKQLYNVMLLVNLGRWCGKIKPLFSVNFKYELGTACDSRCKEHFSSLNNILFLKFDEYFMNSDSYFIRDSIILGRMFPACTAYQFQRCYLMCGDPMCSTPGD